MLGSRLCRCARVPPVAVAYQGAVRSELANRQPGPRRSGAQATGGSSAAGGRGASRQAGATGRPDVTATTPKALLHDTCQGGHERPRSLPRPRAFACSQVTLAVLLAFLCRSVVGVWSPEEHRRPGWRSAGPVRATTPGQGCSRGRSPYMVESGSARARQSASVMTSQSAGILLGHQWCGRAPPCTPQTPVLPADRLVPALVAHPELAGVLQDLEVATCSSSPLLWPWMRLWAEYRTRGQAQVRQRCTSTASSGVVLPDRASAACPGPRRRWPRPRAEGLSSRILRGRRLFVMGRSGHLASTAGGWRDGGSPRPVALGFVARALAPRRRLRLPRTGRRLAGSRARSGRSLREMTWLTAPDPGWPHR
jgi:hypothetical protein